MSKPVIIITVINTIIIIATRTNGRPVFWTPYRLIWRDIWHPRGNKKTWRNCHFAEIFIDIRVPKQSCPCMATHHEGRRQKADSSGRTQSLVLDFHINLLAPELFFFFNFSTPVYKMWIIQEPNKLELWNKLHFEEEKTERKYHV